MVKFVDHFDRANADIASGANGWNARNSADTLTGLVEIFNEYATNTGTTDCVIAQTNTAGNVPTTDAQEVRGSVTSTAQGTNQRIDLGLGMNGDPKTDAWATLEFGIAVRLEYLASGERKLSILEQMGTATSATTLASLTMVASGGVEQTGYLGHLLDRGALGVPQEIRLVVNPRPEGLRVRAYVNSEDDDAPTLQAVARSNWTAPANALAFGYQYARFMGAQGAKTLALLEFVGRDWSHDSRADLGERSNDDARFSDWPTLGEVRRRVAIKLERSLNTSIAADILNLEIGYAYDEILNTVGDQAWFRRRIETVTLTTDNDGYATMPAYVERVLDLERSGRLGKLPWAFSHLNESGRVVVRIGTTFASSSTSVLMTYVARPTRASRDDDKIAFPDNHIELLVTGAVLRLAENDRSPQFTGTQQARFNRLMGDLMRDMGRQGDLARAVFTPTRRRFHRQWRESRVTVT